MSADPTDDMFQEPDMEFGDAPPAQLPGERFLGDEPAPKKPNTPARPIFTLSLPADNDPAVILGHRYLNKGDGAVLSSSSGMGKSAMAIQMSVRWSLALDAFGIKPARALRVLYIQSEDSDGDVAEVTVSIAHTLSLSHEQIAQANTNVVIVTDRVSRGAKFLAQLKLHIASHKPDLVVINPLQAFMDGDITASQDIGEFLREGLNALNEPAQFAYLLVHHTTKPATGKDKAVRAWHEQMYDMAGGAEIINWARAILTLKATDTYGHFNLTLAKRGVRAGVTKQVEHGAGYRLEPVTVIPLKHSEEHLPSGQRSIYWESREADEPATKTPAKDTNLGGASVKFDYANYRSVLPKKSDPGKPFNEILRACNDNGAIPKGSLQAVLNRWAKENVLEIIRPESGPTRYRSAV